MPTGHYEIPCDSCKKPITIKFSVRCPYISKSDWVGSEMVTSWQRQGRPEYIWFNHK